MSAAPPGWFRFVAKLVASLLLGAVLAMLAQRGGLPLLPPLEAVAAVRPWGVPLYLALMVCAFVFRAARWRSLLTPLGRSVSLRDVILLNWVGFLFIFVLPFRMGEFVRPALFRLRCGVPVPAVLGAVVVERVFDGLAAGTLVLCTLLALPGAGAGPRTAELVPAAAVSLSVFGGGLVLLAGLAWGHEAVVARIDATLGAASPRLGAMAGRVLGQVGRGLGMLGSPRLAARFGLETAAYWSLQVLALWSLAVACDIELSLPAAAATFGIVSLGVMVPAGPGLFGSFQLAATAGLSLFVPASLEGHSAAVLVFLMYTGSVAVLVGLGGSAMLAIRLSIRDIFRAPP